MKIKIQQQEQQNHERKKKLLRKFIEPMLWWFKSHFPHEPTSIIKNANEAEKGEKKERKKKTKYDTTGDNIKHSSDSH